MRHRKHTFKIGRRGSHNRAMLANQACSVILHGRIETTLVKAKEFDSKYAEQQKEREARKAAKEAEKN